jgi:hypothetical protein
MLSDGDVKLSTHVPNGGGDTFSTIPNAVDLASEYMNKLDDAHYLLSLSRKSKRVDCLEQSPNYNNYWHHDISSTHAKNIFSNTEKFEVPMIVDDNIKEIEKKTSGTLLHESDYIQKVFCKILPQSNVHQEKKEFCKRSYQYDNTLNAPKKYSNPSETKERPKELTVNSSSF